MLRSIRPVFFAFSLIFASHSAQANIPLRQLLESAAGRFILGETSVGARLSARVLGQEVGLLERHSYLAKALEDRRYSTTAIELENRLNRLEVDAGWRLDANNNPFRVSTRSLLPHERQIIEHSLWTYLDDAYIEFIPTAVRPFSAQAYAKAQKAFLTAKPGSKTRAIDSLMKMADEAPYSMNAYAFRAYESMRELDPQFVRVFSRKSVYALLADEEMTVFSKRLNDLLATLEQDSTGRSMKNKINAALRKTLRGKVPASSIEARLRGLKTGKIEDLRRALGDMTLAETNQLLHGGNPLAPTRESLIGKYIEETGAATVTRTFPVDPSAVPGPRPERLVVAVSEQSFASYLKYFANESLLVHVHTPRQGTLMIAFDGKAGSYASPSSPMRTPTQGSLLPHIVLKTSEGQRAAQYFKLGAQDSNVAQWPWRLPNYCATGGYNSCTHWFGNIPIGDKLVKQYKFPGAIDNYAYNRVPETADPRVQDLMPYDHPNPLVKRVWKTPGNEQLADAIGLQAQNLAGELASPGFVAHSLVGPAPVERVPVVFLVVRDHRAPILSDFDPMMRVY